MKISLTQLTFDGHNIEMNLFINESNLSQHLFALMVTYNTAAPTYLQLVPSTSMSRDVSVARSLQKKRKMHVTSYMIIESKITLLLIHFCLLFHRELGLIYTTRSNYNVDNVTSNMDLQ